MAGMDQHLANLDKRIRRLEQIIEQQFGKARALIGLYRRTGNVHRAGGAGDSGRTANGGIRLPPLVRR